jgi:hypothetical protein
MSKTETATFKYDCPFDLEAIFTVSINLDNLKGIIEFILQRLQGHDSHFKKNDVQINEIDVKLMSKLL